jgi:hypothetical protein
MERGQSLQLLIGTRALPAHSFQLTSHTRFQPGFSSHPCSFCHLSVCGRYTGQGIMGMSLVDKGLVAKEESVAFRTMMPQSGANPGEPPRA